MGPLKRAAIVCGSALVTMCVLGCAPGKNVASTLLAEPTSAPVEKGQVRCRISASQLSPLIVEWPATERAALESALAGPVIVVRYAGCELEVLRGCGPLLYTSYRYRGITPKSETVTMRDADELYARMPVGAARLEAKLGHAAALRSDMHLVGSYSASKGAFEQDELSGRCEGATHYVDGVQVGAYVFAADQSLAVAGRGELSGGPAAGASSEAQREVLSRDGDPERCAEAMSGDRAPPVGCASPLRLQLQPLGLPTCDDGNPSCDPLPVPSPAPTRLSRKNRRLQSACDARDMHACATLGQHFAEGTHHRKAQPDPSRALELFSLACNGGEPYACLGVAGLYSDDERTVPDDLDAALFHRALACEMGYSMGCIQLALTLLVQDPDDRARPAQLLRDACRTDWYACDLRRERCKEGQVAFCD